MKSIFGFIIEPIGGRYNNVKKLGEKEYGTFDINIQDGTINYKKENGKVNS